MQTPLTVDIWSDIACPWCFLGKRRFERAVRESGVPVRVEYHAFALVPDTPVDFAGSAVDFLAGHLGIPLAQAERMTADMTELAATEGLRYDYAALRSTRTLLAHQAIAYAKAHDRQEALVERLFQAHWEQGRHVGRVDELVALAGEVGLDGAATREALTEDRYAAAVTEDITTAARLGVRGVPFYLINRAYAVSGAQRSEVFAVALHRVAGDLPAGADLPAPTSRQ